MYLQTCGCFKSAKKLESANCKSTIDKSANNKKYSSSSFIEPPGSANRKSAKCRICDLRTLFLDWPPLLFISAMRLTEQEL
jgi:hypothetical protein